MSGSELKFADSGDNRGAWLHNPKGLMCVVSTHVLEYVAVYPGLPKGSDKTWPYAMSFGDEGLTLQIPGDKQGDAPLIVSMAKVVALVKASLVN